MKKEVTTNGVRVNLRVFEGFAGYGGASFALRRLKRRGFLDSKTIGFSEVYPNPVVLSDNCVLLSTR